MRICLVAESYPPALGGVEFALQNLVAEFIAKGHEVQVITSSWQRHAPGIENHGSLTVTRIFTLPVFKRFWFILFSLPKVFQAARWADIVQGSMFAGGPPAFLGAWIAGKKKVLIVYEVFGRRWLRLEPNLLRSLFYYLTERIIVRLPFDRYIAISNYTKESLRSTGVLEKKINVIYCGNSTLDTPSIASAEVRHQLGFEEKDFVFLSYGRTGVTKGFEYLLGAIPEITRQLQNARFVLILSGYDSRIWTNVQRYVSSFPPHICKLVPPLSRELLAAYVSSADCVVIPSLSEGFGFCALEACNASKTVVATNAGSLPEVIFGKHVFVEPGSVPAIVEGCMKAYRGEVTETTPKTFDWEHTASLYCQIYKELLAS